MFHVTIIPFLEKFLVSRDKGKILQVFLGQVLQFAGILPLYSTWLSSVHRFRTLNSPTLQQMVSKQLLHEVLDQKYGWLAKGADKGVDASARKGSRILFHLLFLDLLSLLLKANSLLLAHLLQGVGQDKET